jgi:hypothetical protein
MSNIVDIDSARPTDTQLIQCGKCGFNWLAVFPKGCDELECKGCHGWVNLYGVPINRSVCRDCGGKFTVTPASETFGDQCLADDCASYDVSRDAEIGMGFKEPPTTH